MFEPYKIRVADADADEGVVVALDQEEGFVVEPPSVAAMGSKLFSIICRPVAWVKRIVSSHEWAYFCILFLSYMASSCTVVGAFVGTIFSILWLWLWHSIVLKAYVSHLKIRILVVVVAAGFCVAFALYVIQYWFMVEVSLHISRKLPS